MEPPLTLSVRCRLTEKELVSALRYANWRCPGAAAESRML